MLTRVVISLKILHIVGYFFVQYIFPFESRGLGQAKPEPSRERWLWLGLRFYKAGSGLGQAKAAAFRPSQAVQSTSAKLNGDALLYYQI